MTLQSPDVYVTSASRDHPRRTMPTAHKWIIENWDELEHGQVVDVEFILGIASEPKIAERLTVFGYQE